MKPLINRVGVQTYNTSMFGNRIERTVNRCLPRGLLYIVGLKRIPTSTSRLERQRKFWLPENPYGVYEKQRFRQKRATPTELCGLRRLRPRVFF